MTPDNYFIAGQFSLLSKLMDIHGENSFRSKTYSVAAFNMEKLPVQLSSLPPEKIFGLKGIGESTGKKIIEIINQGSLSALRNLIQKTPPGVMEMLAIKGLGPKKISVIWKEMDIETPGELLYACTENRLSRYKGFGAKSQQSIQEAISFYMQSQGSHLYAEIERYALELDRQLKAAFPGELFEPTGDFRRQCEVIDLLEWVTTATTDKLNEYAGNQGFSPEETTAGSISFRTSEKILIRLYSRTRDVFFETLFHTTGSEAFLEAWKELPAATASSPTSEEEMFTSRKLHVIPAFLREDREAIREASARDFDDLITPEDIRAIIHSHSDWSDGSNTVEEMAEACIQRGLEYMVISDHSKSAAYANGLSEERIKQQHLYVDELNARFAPFRIFKSIEADILGDGSLDYSDNLLSTFDLVIASVHSNLKMPEEKAMARLMKAISNPYTTILGHMTGRLLLSRPGYPVDHKAIIDACAKHRVVIEINANPRRLDMDWRWVGYALEKNVMLSVNPDAHDTAEFDNCRFGVLAARKGGLKKESNLSSMGLKEFEKFLQTKNLNR